MIISEEWLSVDKLPAEDIGQRVPASTVPFLPAMVATQVLIFSGVTFFAVTSASAEFASKVIERHLAW